MRWVPALLLALAWSAPAGAQVTVYEHGYAFNSSDLNENHFIVLDSVISPPRGWYYGTSDEFDQAREGYLPGFFVAPMEGLTLSASTISFALRRPERFFASPVPFTYRSADAVPAGVFGDWTVRLPEESRHYVGATSSDQITLDLPGGPRVFRRR